MMLAIHYRSDLNENFVDQYIINVHKVELKVRTSDK